MSRRIPEYGDGYVGFNKIATLGSIITILSTIVLIIVIRDALLRDKDMEDKEEYNSKYWGRIVRKLDAPRWGRGPLVMIDYESNKGWNRFVRRKEKMAKEKELNERGEVLRGIDEKGYFTSAEVERDNKKYMELRGGNRYDMGIEYVLGSPSNYHTYNESPRT